MSATTQEGDAVPEGDLSGVGTQIGPYKLLDVLGEGGMGTVYLAEQREPVRRRVALKLIKPGMDSREVLARFDAERQALAMMNHPNIAKVLDSGATAQGRPYFAMDLVPGMPLTHYCDRQRLTMEQRLELFVDVCRGVQHAHQKGVIHRDLKPSNILVQLVDGRPVPKIIDFGVAKAIEQRLTERTLFTAQGAIIGTPEYMSPEQADMSGLHVDARTDVYSLGVVLYELLAGSLPFPAHELRQAGMLEIQRRIREEDPPKPSTRLTTRDRDSATTAQQRQTDLATLMRKLRGDLDWVTMRALEKDPTRRYQTCSELAADVQRYLARLPVEAGPPSAAYRARKFVQRNRLQVAAGAAVILALVGGLAVSLWFFFDARAAQQREALARGEAEANGRAAARALAKFDMAASAVRLRELIAAEPELFPARPDRVVAMEHWLDEARALAAQLPDLRAALDDLKANDESPGDGGDRWPRFLQGMLTAQVALLEELTRPETGQLARVAERADWARRVEKRTVFDEAAAWDRAIAGIRSSNGVVASELYAGLELEPQVGLVPLAMDPETKLWEFVHLRSGTPGSERPERIPGSTRWLVTPDTGIVFVLIPGGLATIGAQSATESPNYDPHALRDESPVQRIRLAPFFLSKYEMTQGQWYRLSGENPSQYPKRSQPLVPAGAWLPVEQVSWTACDRLLTQHELVLPTEAQWEYTCRAGTATPWWTGAERESLHGAANLADATAKDGGASWQTIRDWPEFRDGHVVQAPVSTMRPNPFGLHHMHGNVWEWCRDHFDYYGTEELRAGDGLRTTAEYDLRVFRGGSFADTAADSRSARRFRITPEHLSNTVGVRPARMITRR